MLRATVKLILFYHASKCELTKQKGKLRFLQGKMQEFIEVET